MIARPVALRGLLGIAAIVAPVLAGGIIYYSLRASHPKTAHVANWISFASFFATASLVPTPWSQGDGRLAIGIVVGLGVVVAWLGVRLLRATEPVTRA